MIRTKFTALLATTMAVAMLLTACGTPRTAESSSESAPEASVSASESRSEPISTAEPSPYSWTPPEKPGAETLSDMAYWDQQFRYIYTAYPDMFAWDGSDEAGGRIAPLLNRDGILEQLPVSDGSSLEGDTPRDGERFAVLTAEEYKALLGLYYGPRAAAAANLDSILDADGNILLSDLSFNINPTQNDSYELAHVTQLDQAMERIALVVNHYDWIQGYNYETGEPFEEHYELSAEHQYILRWDGVVGYVAEEISWAFVPTDRVRINGDVRTFDLLWDQSGEVVANRTFYETLWVNGDDVYRFSIRDKAVLYDHINLATLEQSAGQTLYAFEVAPDRLWQLQNSIAVMSDGMLYEFDGTLQLQRQVPYPEAMPANGAALLNDALTQATFCKDNSLYLLDLVPRAEPRLLYTHEHGEDVVEFEDIYPVRFVHGGRILVGVGGWEALAVKYLLLDADGNQLAEIPFFVSEEHSGGYSFADTAGIAHDYGHDWQYFNFDTLQLSPADFMGFSYHGWWMETAGAPSHPAIRYFSQPKGPELLPEKTIFHMVDFGGGTDLELPFSVTGAVAKLLAVTDSGRMLFCYNYKTEQGFGVSGIE